MAFHLSDGRSRAAVVTDLGTLTESLCRALRGVDILVLEANHDESTVRRKLADPGHVPDWQYLSWVLSGHGHLSNRQCAEGLASILTGKEVHVLLAHLSENHTDPRRDNNHHLTARMDISRLLERERIPLPVFHRTHRIGLEQGGPGAVIEVG